MPVILAALISVPSNVGLPLLFVIIAVETLGVPAPGEIALVTGGILASQGKLSIEAVIAVAAAAAIIGDNVGYLLGRSLGRAVLLKPGPLLEHRRAIIEHGEPFFAKHGPKAVFLGRWTAGLRIAAAWLAGTSGMKWSTFSLYNAAGGIAWAASVGLAAYYAGHAAERWLKTIGLVGAGLAVVALVVWLLIRRRRRSAI